MKHADVSPKVFLCFSGKIRESAAEAFSYHLRKYGLDVWYDFHELFLGDHGDTKNLAGVESSQYAVLLISDDFFHRTGTLFELERMEALWHDGKLVIMPLLYNVSSANIPEGFRWLNELIYAQIGEDKTLENVALQVVARLYHDMANRCPLPSLNMLAQSRAVEESGFLFQAIEFYRSISPSNLTARLTTLLLIAKLVDPLSIGEKSICTCLDRLSAYTQLDLNTDFKEISIAENCVIVLLNKKLTQSKSSHSDSDTA